MLSSRKERNTLEAENAELLRLIAPAKAIAHTGSNLYEHLVGTALLLRLWSAPNWLVRAGLLHSIYSTQYFHENLFDVHARRSVADHATEASEHLAFLFCTVDREHLWKNLHLSAIPDLAETYDYETKTVVCLNKREMESLALLEVANFVEQAYDIDGAPAPDISWTISTLQRLPNEIVGSQMRLLPKLSHETELKAKRSYFDFLASGTSEEDNLRKCIGASPLWPEPHFFLGIFLWSKNRVGEATGYFERFLKLDAIWGSAWERRLAPWFREEAINLLQDSSFNAEKFSPANALPIIKQSLEKKYFPL
jgi:hypothetical protein